MSWADGDVPDEWNLRRIGEITQVVGGGTPKTGVAGNFSEEVGVAWITPADMKNYTDKYISHGRRFLTDQGLAASSARAMPAGTVIFSSRAPIGYVAIASNPLTTNQGFRSLVPSKEINSEYLYYAMKYLSPLAEQVASGTTFPEISGSKLASLPIAYPTLPEQRAIARILDALTRHRREAASHLTTARSAIERFRQAIRSAACMGNLTSDWREVHPDAQSVKHTLVDRRAMIRAKKIVDAPVALALPDLPEKYMTATIGQAAEIIQYGTSQQLDATAVDSVPILRMGNIQYGRLDLRELKYHARDKEIEKILLRDGDLLFNRTNSPELVGKSAVYHGHEPTSFASYLIRVRFTSDICDPDFANYWINSAWGRAWAQLVKTDGVSQSNINGTKLAAMPLPLPPIDEQQEIVRRASKLLSIADTLLTQLDDASRATERTSQAILAKAFRGGILPPQAENSA